MENKSELTQLGLKYGTDKATYHHYTEFYHEHLNPRRAKINTVLEIGVWDGHSLEMWRDYLPHAQIIGIDIWLHHFPSGCLVIEGNAANPNLYSQHASLRGKTFDLIIDDGSHKCSDQQNAFKLLWPKLNHGGVYIIEDVHTSFMPQYMDTEHTTYDLLRLKTLFMEFWFLDWDGEVSDSFEFWRVPGNTSDSGTIILIKK
jgi:hypothetical protein